MELSCLTWTCITSLVWQQFTRQLITAHVQVIASTLPPHTSAAHFKETCISLQPWRDANMYTVTIAHPHHHRRHRQQHLKGCGWLRAWIRTSEVDITIHSKREPKRSKQLSRSLYGETWTSIYLYGSAGHVTLHGVGAKQ